MTPTVTRPVRAVRRLISASSRPPGLTRLVSSVTKRVQTSSGRGRSATRRRG